MPDPNCQQFLQITGQTGSIWPKKDTSVCINVHLVAFSCNPKLLKHSNTSVSRSRASDTSALKEITSSRYTKQRDQRMPDRTQSMSLSKVVGVLQSPKGITQNWKSASCVTNAVFRLASGDMSTCHYPLAKSHHGKPLLATRQPQLIVYLRQGVCVWLVVWPTSSKTKSKTDLFVTPLSKTGQHNGVI